MLKLILNIRISSRESFMGIECNTNLNPKHAKAKSKPYYPLVCEMDLVLMVDSSGSINSTGHNNWAKVLGFLSKLALTIDLRETHVALVTFSNYAEMEFDLNRYKSQQDLVYAMKHVRYDVSGAGAWYDGLY